jgi:hypothetical protein
VSLHPLNLLSRHGKPAPLDAWIGKYPFEKIEGVTFLNHPITVAAVRKAVPDERLRKTVLVAGTCPYDAVIRQGTEFTTFGCRFHACGDFAWAIYVDPQRQSARVCYHESAMGNESRWYGTTGTTKMVAGDCPSTAS